MFFLRGLVASSSKHPLAAARVSLQSRLMSLGPGCRPDRWGKCVEHGSEHEKDDEAFEELQRRPKVEPTEKGEASAPVDKEQAAIQALLERDGGGLGFEFEDGKPDSGMRKGVKREMFRLI